MKKIGENLLVLDPSLLSKIFFCKHVIGLCILKQLIGDLLPKAAKTVRLGLAREKGRPHQFKTLLTETLYLNLEDKDENDQDHQDNCYLLVAFQIIQISQLNIR